MRGVLISPEALVRLVIGIILAVAVLSIVMKCAAPWIADADSSRVSFERVVRMVKEADTWSVGTAQSVDIQLDEGTSILAINDVPEVQFLYPQQPTKAFYIARPRQCDHSCICLCQSPFKPDSAFTDAKIVLYCENPVCEDVSFAFARINTPEVQSTGGFTVTSSVGLDKVIVKKTEDGVAVCTTC